MTLAARLGSVGPKCGHLIVIAGEKDRQTGQRLTGDLSRDRWKRDESRDMQGQGVGFKAQAQAIFRHSTSITMQALTWVQPAPFTLGINPVAFAVTFAATAA